MCGLLCSFVSGWGVQFLQKARCSPFSRTTNAITKWSCVQGDQIGVHFGEKVIELHM